MAGPYADRPFLVSEGGEGSSHIYFESVGDSLAAAASYVVEFVLVDFPAQCIAVDPEDFCGAGLISVKTFQNASYEFLFEFCERFFEEYASLDHRVDKRFQLLFHFSMLQNGKRCQFDLHGLALARYACFSAVTIRALIHSSSWPVIR
jgi:hypothetical protein